MGRVLDEEGWLVLALGTVLDFRGGFKGFTIRKGAFFLFIWILGLLKLELVIETDFSIRFDT